MAQMAEKVKDEPLCTAYSKSRHFSKLDFDTKY